MASTPASGSAFVVRSRVFSPAAPAVMAIINRTSDSFYAGARHLDTSSARQAVEHAVNAGADIIDIGGVKAGPGEPVSEAEEIDRVAPFVSWVRSAVPDLIVSVDTWRSGVADAVVGCGADVVNDTWAGHDPHLVQVAAARHAAIVCSHTGAAVPRSRPHRDRYGEHPDDVVADVVAHLAASATRATQAGIPAERILLDPTLDFGKNTWQSLALVRHADQIVALGYPVLMALSRKDFIGETLDLPVDQRLAGTIAATAIAAWHGAVVFRAHDVAATRHAVDLVASVRGDRPPRRAIRALA